MQQFVVPPGWPTPPPGWVPPAGWTPDPAWPPAPAGWAFWREADAPAPALAPTPYAGAPVYSGSPAQPSTTPFPGTPTYPGAPTYPMGSPGSGWAAMPKPVVDNTFAWIIAVAPLSLILLHLALRSVDPAISDLLSVLVPLGMYVSLAVADSRRLARAGVSVSPAWGLIVLVYVILRTQRARQTWAIPVVFLVSVLTFGATAAFMALPDEIEYDPRGLEREIAAQYASDYDLTVVAECSEDASAPVGGVIDCSVTYASGERYTVKVDVLNAEGDWTWREMVP